MEKSFCSKCGNWIGNNNYSRHIRSCDGNFKPATKTHYRVSHEGLSCIFCGKELKNLNALTQHEIRCKLNPNRSESSKRDFKLQYKNLPKETKEKMAWNKGLTAKTSEAIRRAAENRPKHRVFTYLYEHHNNSEIQKWLNFVNSVNVKIPEYKLTNSIKNINFYNTISCKQKVVGSSVKLLFEHNYIANIYINNNLKPENTVHHIDRNIKNNDITNLLIFDTTNDHKRFHNSKYAWLIYNDNTHKFKCILKKDSAGLIIG